MTWLSALAAKAIEAAASLTGKKFALMVASSLVATTGIVAAGLTAGGTDLGPLAGLLGRDLASGRAPEGSSPAAGGAAAAGSGEAGSGAGSPALPASAPAGGEAGPWPEAGEEGSPASRPEAEPGPVQHVFVISLASPGHDAAFGSAPQMPYLATELRPQGTLLGDYTLLSEAPLANSIAAISGQPPNPMTTANCPTYVNFPASARPNSKGAISGSGCIYPVETLSIADQMAGKRLRWHAYMEDMVDASGAPDNCVAPQPEGSETPVPGGYSARLNPFVFFHSLLDLGDCATNDVPLGELDKDLKKVETTPNLSYISPNLCNAGVAGECPAGSPQGAAAADAFLASVAPKILKSPAYEQDGLIVVVFNQVSPPPPDPATGQVAAPPAEPLKVGALLVSRFASPGATDAAPYGPYALLRSLEDLFRLDHLANAAPAKVRSFAGSLEGLNAGD